MDRTSAERLMSAALALDAPLGELDSVISGIADEQERAIFVEALGEVFRSINEGFPAGRTRVS